jgi:hypothetical protein
MLEPIKTFAWGTAWILGYGLWITALCVAILLSALGLLFGGLVIGLINSLGIFRGSSFIPHINP